jgi:hypothetical protein
MSISLEQLTHDQLSEMFPTGVYALDFSNNHYVDLLNSLTAVFGAEQVIKRRGTIHRAISDHFSKSDQKVSVIFHSGQIVVQKEFDSLDYDEESDRLNYIVKSKLKEIITNADEYKPIPSMWVIPKSHKDELIKAYEKTTASTNEIREFLKFNLKEQFDLTHRDIVLFLREKIFIREYTPPRVYPDGVDKRFAGLDKEEVERLYEENFPDGLEDKIVSIMPEVLAEKLNFSIIDNATFIRDFIPVFRSMIEIIILESGLDLDHITLEGLSGYVLRVNFDKILYLCAKNLFEHLERRDRNAELFIKYYTDDVIIDSKGKRIQKYAIVDSNGQKWNSTAILSIIIQNKESDKKIERQEQQILMVKDRFDKAGNDLIVAESRKDQTNAKFQEMVMEIKSLEMQTQSLNSRMSTKSKNEIENEKLALQRKRLNLLDSKKSMQIKKDQVDREFRNKSTELTNWENRLRKEKQLLSQIKSSILTIKENYEMLLRALVITFMKR